MDIIKHDSHIPASLSRRTAPVVDVSANIAQRIVIVTDDKLRLALGPLAEENKRIRHESWIGPASLLATILTTLASTNFATASLLGIGGENLHGMYFGAALASAGWLLYVWCNRPRPRSIESIIAAIRNCGTSPNEESPRVDA